MHAAKRNSQVIGRLLSWQYHEQVLASMPLQAHTVQ